jgi:hypothetical protein
VTRAVAAGAAMLAVAAAPLALAAGCSDDEEPARTEPTRTEPGRTDPARTERERPPRTERLEPAHCPPELANCKTADGRIVYVERVDPDGDGDAHFVLSSDEAITLPGVSVIDVKRSLRPRPLPGVGDRISAAGPVYRGSFGQKQIEAIELHVARSR